MSHSRPPRWNFVSVVTFFVGFLGGVVVGTAGQGALWTGHPMDGIFWGVLVWTVFCVLGLVAAVVAWSRSERFWGVTAVGFALNAFLPGAFLLTGISNLVMWLRYG